MWSTGENALSTYEGMYINGKWEEDLQRHMHWWMIEMSGRECRWKVEVVGNEWCNEGRSRMEWEGVQNDPNWKFLSEDSSSIGTLPFATKTHPHLPNVIALKKSYLILWEMYSRKKRREEWSSQTWKCSWDCIHYCILRSLCVTDAVQKFDRL